MSMDYWFRGRLEFSDEGAIASANAALEQEGYLRHEDNLLGEDELRWKATTLTIDARGSMPYSCFDISSDVLRVYAMYATKGEVLALNVEDGFGERYAAAGGDVGADNSDELEDDEVDALLAEYGGDGD